MIAGWLHVLQHDAVVGVCARMCRGVAMCRTVVLHEESNTSQASPRMTSRIVVSFTRVHRGGWFGFVRFALLRAVFLCRVGRCMDSWVFLGLLCLLRVTQACADSFFHAVASPSHYIVNTCTCTQPHERLYKYSHF